jgi:predicted metallopeptidase
MRYQEDPQILDIARDVVSKLKLSHVDMDNIVILRSHGSKSRRTLARIHGLPKIMQLAMKRKALYVIEIISETFDRQSRDDQVKTVIHELMHIPHGFGGGFRNHRNYVTRKNVDMAFQEYMRYS